MNLVMEKQSDLPRNPGGINWRSRTPPLVSSTFWWGPRSKVAEGEARLQDCFCLPTFAPCWQVHRPHCYCSCHPSPAAESHFSFWGFPMPSENLQVSRSSPGWQYRPGCGTLRHLSLWNEPVRFSAPPSSVHWVSSMQMLALCPVDPSYFDFPLSSDEREFISKFFII